MLLVGRFDDTLKGVLVARRLYLLLSRILARRLGLLVCFCSVKAWFSVVGMRNLASALRNGVLAAGAIGRFINPCGHLCPWRRMREYGGWDKRICWRT